MHVGRREPTDPIFKPDDFLVFAILLIATGFCLRYYQENISKPVNPESAPMSNDPFHFPDERPR